MDEYIKKWPVVNRLIDLENEFQRYKPFHGFEHAMYRKLCEVENAIGKTPEADVAPVRHRRWIIDSAGGKIACSDCGCIYLGYNGRLTPNYCPNCGAIMDGGETRQ